MLLLLPEPPRIPPPAAEALPASEREYAHERLDGLPVGVGVMVPPALPDATLALRLAVLTLRALPLSPSYVDMVEAVRAGARLLDIMEE